MYDRGRLLIGGFDNVAAAVEYASNIACVEPESVRAAWPRARAAFLAGSFTPSLHTEELDAELQRDLLDRMQTTLFRASVNEQSWRLASVPLAALVTSQPYINLTLYPATPAIDFVISSNLAILV